MCVTAARDIDVFTYAQDRHRQIRNSANLPHGGEDEFLKVRLARMKAMLKMLTLLKANIALLTKSPL
jgi:hypothetical protein